MSGYGEADDSFSPCGLGAEAALTGSATGATVTGVDAPTRKTFWSKGRRRALSSTSLTLFQVLLGGTVLGGVFGRFGFVAKSVLVVSLAVLFVTGILSVPDE